MALVVKNLPVSAGDIRYAGLIPGSWRSPGEGKHAHKRPVMEVMCFELILYQDVCWDVRNLGSTDSSDAGGNSGFEVSDPKVLADEKPGYEENLRNE